MVYVYVDIARNLYLSFRSDDYFVVVGGKYIQHPRTMKSAENCHHKV